MKSVLAMGAGGSGGNVETQFSRNGSGGLLK